MSRTEPGLLGCAVLADEVAASARLHQPELRERIPVVLGRIRREAAEHHLLKPCDAAAISDVTVPTAMRAARSGGKR